MTMTTGLLTQGDPQQYSRCTAAVHCQRVFECTGVFHPCLWPEKAPGCTLGRGSSSVSSALWRHYPLCTDI